MITTLTPNPSIDRTMLVENLLPGEVNRVASSRTDPGGKGVNVARALIRNGHPARAILPLGGPDGELLAPGFLSTPSPSQGPHGPTWPSSIPQGPPPR